MRSLEDLIDTEAPGWPLVEEWIRNGSNAVEVLPADRDQADRALHETQVTTRSPMGAVLHETGGLLVDHGWLRILGSGCERLPRSLPDWNRVAREATPALGDAHLLVADDALGGLFTINGGAFDTAPGNLLYFAPDSLEWDDLEISYSQFLNWAFGGDLDAFYGPLRWPGWEDEIAPLAGDRALSIYPPLWTEPQLSAAERSRKDVPLLEVVGLNASAAED